MPDQNKEKLFEEWLQATKDCVLLVGEHFKDNPDKAALWWRTDSPLLGSEAPVNFLDRNPVRLLKILKGWKDGNFQ